MNGSRSWQLGHGVGKVLPLACTGHSVSFVLVLPTYVTCLKPDRAIDVAAM
jgi:hypothetical protein